MARFRQQMADHARGERLRTLRTDRRLNQEDAAHEIGVSTKTLRTWEKGGPIRWDNAKAAAEFYEVDARSLVEREPGTPIDAPDVDGDVDQLDRIERKLDKIMVALRINEERVPSEKLAGDAVAGLLDSGQDPSKASPRKDGKDRSTAKTGRAG